VIVQHVDKAFAEGMAQWLDSQTELPVRVAVSGDRPQARRSLLAATNDHLHIARTGSLEYTR
jgi:two-component system response regulator WspF